ncbi:MAG: FHA domain-containing protein [Anaerolineae bacterium]
MQRQDTILRRPSPKKGQVAWLSALRGPHTGHDWMLAEDNTLGRGSTDPCDIVLSDAKVSSGQHARIRLQKDGTYHLADLASRNGTWVNGQRVERHTLSSGEKIVIGDTELIFMQADIRPTKGRRGPGGAQ